MIRSCQGLADDPIRRVDLELDMESFSRQPEGQETVPSQGRLDENLWIWQMDRCR